MHYRLPELKNILPRRELKRSHPLKYALLAKSGLTISLVGLGAVGILTDPAWGWPLFFFFTLLFVVAFLGSYVVVREWRRAFSVALGAEMYVALRYLGLRSWWYAVLISALVIALFVYFRQHESRRSFS